MDYFLSCAICGLDIDSELIHTRRRWQAHYQSMELREVWDRDTLQFVTPENGRLVRPSFNGNRIPSDLRFLHYACWDVVTKVFGTKEFGKVWLRRFYDSVNAVGPIAKFITPAAPDCRGENVFQSGPTSQLPSLPLNETDTDTPLYSGRSASPDIFERFNLPAEIVQQIYSFLPTYTDIMNLESVTTQGASAWVWLSVGQKLIAAHSSLVKTEPLHLSVLVRNALRNIEMSPRDYPRATNYARVWDGIMNTLRDMEKPPAGQEEGSQQFISLSALPYSDEPFAHTKELSIPSRFSELTVRFQAFGDGLFLCGLSFDGILLGYRGDQELTYHIKAHRLHGLHLAVRDGLTFTARVKTENGWGRWLPPGMPWGPHPSNEYLVIDPTEELGGLQACFNAFRILHMRYATRSQREMLDPFPCRRNIPPSRILPPICLVDRIPNDYRTLNFIVTYDMAHVTAITAYVVPASRKIMGFEIAYKNDIYVFRPEEVTRVPEYAKLTFPLASDMDEVLSSFECAEASLNSGISVKFQTSLGRSVLFGDDTPEFWTFGPLASGFFFAMPNSEDGPISRIGMFSDNDIDTPPQTYVQPLTWPTIDSSCLHEASTAFVSSASLKSVSWIVICYREQMFSITGMLLIYENSPPAVLGVMEDEYVSIAIREPITRIQVHIQRPTCSFLYQIMQISFISDNRVIGSEPWDESNYEVVNVDVPEDEVDPPLYWAFQQREMSCLSFSLDDFVSNHPPGGVNI